MQPYKVVGGMGASSQTANLARTFGVVFGCELNFITYMMAACSFDFNFG
jgi:hypothetical protein